MQRYHLAWRHALLLFLSKTKDLLKWIWNGGKTEFPLGNATAERTKDNSILKNIGDFLRQCARPFVHAGGSINRSWRRVGEEWKDFRMWWHDPLDRSGKPHFRFPEKRSLHAPLGLDPLALHRSGSLPASFSKQLSPRPSMVPVQSSDHSLSPLLPLDSRLASPPLVAVGHSSTDELVHGQNTFQRHTFERKVSGV